MNSTEIVDLFRNTVGDVAEPFLWSDDEAFMYLDDAQKMFCRLTGGLGDGSSSITQLTYTADSDWVNLSLLILKVRAAVDSVTGRPVAILNMEDLRADQMVFSEARTGTVNALVLGIEPGRVRMSPYPNTEGQINLIVDRLPLKSITNAGDQKLEIAEQHHQFLVMWMMYRAYNKQDAETLNRKASADSELAFRQYCADAMAEKARAMHKTRTVRYGGI